MNGLRAGRFRQRITLVERSGDKTDDYGAPILTWSDAYEHLAADVITKGRAFEAAQQRQQELTHIINIRWIPDVKTRPLSLMRVRLLDGSLLEQIIPPTERELAARELTLTCKRVLNDDD